MLIQTFFCFLFQFILCRDKDLHYLNISDSDASRLNVLDNGTLYFTEVHLEDEGLYGCTIGSSAGFKREEAHLSVRRTYFTISLVF